MTKKYLVFGWSNESDKNGPADEFFGTTSHIEEDREATGRDSAGAEHFGWSVVERKVSTVPNILGGKERDMLVLINYSKSQGLENGTPILAYLEIKERTDG